MSDEPLPSDYDQPDPAVADPASTWKSLDWNAVRAERLVGGIFFGIVGLGLLIGMAIATFAFWPLEIGLALAWLGWLILMAMFLWLAYFLPAIAYRRTSYRLGELGFEIRRGILWRRQITVPLSRIQHTDVAQGPLQRRYQIGKLIVYTAGTQNASVELDGLSFVEASELRNALIIAGESADGV